MRSGGLPRVNSATSGVITARSSAARRPPVLFEVMRPACSAPTTHCLPPRVLPVATQVTTRRRLWLLPPAGPPSLRWASVTADVRPGPARTRRDRAIRVGGVACALAAAAIVVRDDLGAASGWWPAVDVAGGAAACGALWLSRRWPATMALVAVALAVPAASAAVAAGIATLMTALYRRSVVAIGVGAAWVAATLARFWLRPPGLAPYPVWALVAVLFGVALTGWGMLARARRQLVLSLAERVRRAEAEQRRRVEQARHAERTPDRPRDARRARPPAVAAGLHAGALEFRAGRAARGDGEAAAVIRASAHQALAGAARGDRRAARRRAATPAGAAADARRPRRAGRGGARAGMEVGC